MQVCAACGASLASGARFCGYCGAHVPPALLSSRPEWQRALAQLSALSTDLQRAQAGIERARNLLLAGHHAATIDPDTAGLSPDSITSQREEEAAALWKARLQIDLLNTAQQRHATAIAEVRTLLAQLAAAGDV